MPGYKQHAGAAIVLYMMILSACSLNTFPVSKTFEWFLALFIGALFPDIDIKSKGQKLCYCVLVILIGRCLMLKHLYSLAVLALAGCVPLLVRHRGIFHSVQFIIFLVGTVTFFSALMMPKSAERIAFDALFFLGGALLHLWLDLGLRRMLRWR